MKQQSLQIYNHTNMFVVISNNPYEVVPAVCHLRHLWHKLKSGSLFGSYIENISDVGNILMQCATCGTSVTY